MIVDAALDLRALMRIEPGDECPGECGGMITRVEAVWTADHFIVEAICGTCHECWVTVEQRDD